MKTTTIPPLRVSPKLRRQAEAALEKRRTFSGLVLESVKRNIEYRKSRRAFLDRGLASAEQARKTGKYIPAEKVLAKLDRRLAKARQRAA